MLRSISVENYRGFSKRTELTFRPLTILLGRNSSGKSSLTRIIPLLQQSLERQSSSPILWTSDSVDFGNIADVLTHGSEKTELRIGIKIDSTRFLNYLSRQMFGPFRSQAAHNSQLEYVIRLSADGHRTRFNGIEIRHGNQTLEVDWSKDGLVERFVVDGTAYPLGSSTYIVDTKSFFPAITRTVSRDDVARQRHEPLFYDGIAPAVQALVHGRTAKEKIAYLSRTVPYIPREIARTRLRDLPNIVIKKMTETSMKQLSDCSMINGLPQILSFLDYEITPLFLGAGYIGPSRASGKRFDRIQELAVNRLDATGENTAMYVYSLSQSELASFNDLLVRACGHVISVDDSGPGHVSIKVGRQGYAHYENIADVGFGFSQLVPVIAQLHAVRERESFGENYFSDEALFAVEQPELHLHPAMQANLADLFIGAISSPTTIAKRTTVLVETHSETIIGQVGRLVAAGEISPEDVVVYFVGKEEESGLSQIEECSFDSEGIITGWPVGFFSTAQI